MSMVSPAFLAFVLTAVSALIVVAARRWMVWRHCGARHGVVVAVCLAALWIAWYVVVRLIAGGWPRDLGLAAFAPIVPVVALLIGWRINAYDERGREQRQRHRSQEERWIASKRETIADFQFTLIRLHYGLRHSLLTRIDPDRAKDFGLVSGMNEPWAQEFREANIKIEALLTRIDDQDLLETMRHYSRLGNVAGTHEITRENFPFVEPVLNSSFKAVNERAGALYRELGAPPPAEPERPWWRNIW